MSGKILDRKKNREKRTGEKIITDQSELKMCSPIHGLLGRGGSTASFRKKFAIESLITLWYELGMCQSIDVCI